MVFDWIKSRFSTTHQAEEAPAKSNPIHNDESLAGRHALVLAPDKHLHVLVWIPEYQTTKSIASKLNELAIGNWIKFVIQNGTLSYEKIEPDFQTTAEGSLLKVLVPATSPTAFSKKIVGEIPKFDANLTIWSPVFGRVDGHWPSTYPTDVLVDVWVERIHQLNKWTLGSTPADYHRSSTNSLFKLDSCITREGIVVHTIDETSVIFTQDGDICFSTLPNRFEIGDKLNFVRWPLCTDRCRCNIASNSILFEKEFLEIDQREDENACHKTEGHNFVLPITGDNKTDDVLKAIIKSLQAEEGIKLEESIDENDSVKAFLRIYFDSAKQSVTWRLTDIEVAKKTDLIPPGFEKPPPGFEHISPQKPSELKVDETNLLKNYTTFNGTIEVEQLARVQSQSCSDVSSANEVSESYFSTTELDEIKCVSSATDKLMMDNKTAYDSYSFDTAEESLNEFSMNTTPQQATVNINAKLIDFSDEENDLLDTTLTQENENIETNNDDDIEEGEIRDDFSNDNDQDMTSDEIRLRNEKRLVDELYQSAIQDTKSITALTIRFHQTSGLILFTLNCPIQAFRLTEPQILELNIPRSPGNWLKLEVQSSEFRELEFVEPSKTCDVTIYPLLNNIKKAELILQDLPARTSVKKNGDVMVLSECLVEERNKNGFWVCKSPILNTIIDVDGIIDRKCGGVNDQLEAWCVARRHLYYGAYWKIQVARKKQYECINSVNGSSGKAKVTDKKANEPSILPSNPVVENLINISLSPKKVVEREKPTCTVKPLQQTPNDTTSQKCTVERITGAGIICAISDGGYLVYWPDRRLNLRLRKPKDDEGGGMLGYWVDFNGEIANGNCTISKYEFATRPPFKTIPTHEYVVVRAPLEISNRPDQGATVEGFGEIVDSNNLIAQKHRGGKFFGTFGCRADGSWTHQNAQWEILFIYD